MSMLKNLWARDHDLVCGAGTSRTPRRQQPAPAQFNLEALEDRSVPAILFNPSTGVVTIQGNSGNNVAEVRYDDRGTLSVWDDKIVITQKTGVGVETLRLSAVKNVNGFPAKNVRRIDFNGYAGDDTFRNKTSIDSNANGGSGNDLLIGGTGVDRLSGGSGADRLYGGSGNDALDGGTGADALYGGYGADTLHGGRGFSSPSDLAVDYLDGGAHRDTIVNYWDDFHRPEDVMTFDVLDHVDWRSLT